MLTADCAGERDISYLPTVHCGTLGILVGVQSWESIQYIKPKMPDMRCLPLAPFPSRFVCKNNGVLYENQLLQIGLKSEFRQNLGEYASAKIHMHLSVIMLMV